MTTESLETSDHNLHKQTILSIIIPAKNEEEFISRVLGSIKKLSLLFPIEILVIDNGSTDESVSIAKANGVKVLCLPNTSISAVRNFGANSSTGEYLAFIDADVLITEKWIDALGDVLNSMVENPYQVVGARCHAATKTTFLDKYWFNRLLEYSAPYINSGNLITSRVLFSKISGFDESLTTAEDYDFCRRAKKAGAKLINNPDLVSLHLGYPKTIFGFVKRERWHGTQDCESIASLKESKIAWLALLNLILFVATAIHSLINSSYIGIIFYIIFLFLLGATLTLIRFGTKNLKYFLFTSMLFSLYISGRTISLVDRIKKLLIDYLKI